MIEQVSKHADFIREVNDLVERGLPMIDAVVHYCEVHNVEIETVASIVKNHPSMKATVQIEAEDLNYLPRRSRLPI